MAMNGSVLYEDLKNKNLYELIKMHNAVSTLEKKKDKIIQDRMKKNKKY